MCLFGFQGKGAPEAEFDSKDFVALVWWFDRLVGRADIYALTEQDGMFEYEQKCFC